MTDDEVRAELWREQARNRRAATRLRAAALTPTDPGEAQKVREDFAPLAGKIDAEQGAERINKNG